MSGKLRNRLSIAASYFRHKTVLSGGPVEITLESTAKCNLYCPMCPRHIYTFDNENMDLDLYKKIIQDCKDYVEFIWPYGIGEPMIHPSIFQMVMLKENMGEVDAYRKLWNIPGVDEIRFKRDEIQLDGSASPVSHLKGQRRNPCHLLWRGPLYVRYDGLAYPCCYMYDEPP